jgi:chromosome segregation ATPase
MAETKLKRGLIILAGVVAGLIIGFVYGQVRLQSQEKMYLTKIKDVNQRLTQSQRKITQETSLQSALEEEKQQALAEAEKLVKEKGRLSTEGKSLKTKADALETKADSLEKKITSLESTNKHQNERLEKIEAERDGLDKKQKQTAVTLQDKERELAQLDGKYNQCAENNVRLYTIGDELIEKYKKKSLMGTLIEKEPFTQIKKVELENLAQEYKVKMDQQRMRSKQK